MFQHHRLSLNPLPELSILPLSVMLNRLPALNLEKWRATRTGPLATLSPPGIIRPQKSRLMAQRIQNRYTSLNS
ncbi:unnamed protein product [Dibothriocephalus latus]|uniref:Uncharacterized protein n=1 Tax=Dibothriocephalus latus TaxID=60516 RepID=A0A3P7NAI2_DIBLA|nr:unnamed protein product [Dibothriocephalus latus]